MTLDRMSYLSGFTAQDFYSGVGLCRGSLPTGFEVAVMFRMDPRARVALAIAPQFICGNYSNDGLGATRGWRISVVQDPAGTTAYLIRLTYADGAGVSISIDTSLPASSMPFSRTMLVDAFFGTVSSASNDGPTVMLAINGTIVRAGNIALAMGGYTPADAANPFRIGAGPIASPALAPAFQGVSGFAFKDGVPNTPGSSAGFQAVRDLAAANYNQVQAAQDMVGPVSADMSVFTDVFSTRRSLKTPQPTWPAVVGSGVLTREGSSSLRCDASEPHFLDQRWTFQGQVP